MSTAVGSEDKILAFDGDCPMCRRTVGWLLRTKLVKPEQAISNHDLAPEDRDLAYDAGMRNQLVVIDPRTRETRVGADALLWIIRDNPQARWWTSLWMLPGIRQLISTGYQTISYNRRVISPPRQQIVCDCEPQVTVARRLSLIVPLGIMTVAIVAAFGAVAFRTLDLGSAAQGAAAAVAAVGVPWLVWSAIANSFLPTGKRLDYASHLVVTLFVGAIVLLPFCLVGMFLPPSTAFILVAGSILAAVALMFAMQRKRTKALVLSQAWLWGWLLTALLGGAAVYGYFAPLA